MGEISLELIYKRLEELQAGQDGIRTELATLNETLRAMAKSQVSMQREIFRLNDRVTVLTVAVDDGPHTHA